MTNITVNMPTPDMVFEPERQTFPHEAGWCSEQGIPHNWRQPFQHSFTGPRQDEHRRYCANCGLRQSRTPPVSVPAGEWQNE